jgi:mRNA-degrading endonuclease RelE of RelBE toxin-antitoxin system
MATYSVVTLPAAEKQILRIPFPDRRLIVHALVRLKANPRLPASKPIELDVWRLTMHGWRVIYVIDDDDQAITVVRAAPAL